jgi:hypothetical protein
MRIKISNTFTSLIQFVKKTAPATNKVRAVFSIRSNLQVEQISQAITDNDVIFSSLYKRIANLGDQEQS